MLNIFNLDIHLVSETEHFQSGSSKAEPLKSLSAETDPFGLYGTIRCRVLHKWNPTSCLHRRTIIKTLSKGVIYLVKYHEYFQQVYLVQFDSSRNRTMKYTELLRTFALHF